jgi:hypothetical protein
MTTAPRLALCASLAALGLLLPALSSAAPRCGDAHAVANGPFTYEPQNLGTRTFIGSAGTPSGLTLTIKAPGDAGDTFFPGASQGPCEEQALADIRVMDIEKIGDADGQLLESPVSVGDSPLGAQIAAAVAILPSPYSFSVAETAQFAIWVSNPMVAPADYGDYLVVIKAHAPGAGVGTGAGAMLQISLRAPSGVDNVPPTVTIQQPNGDRLLGPIAIAVQANDPEPGSGVNGLWARISSVGGAVSNQALALTLDQGLPVAAGVTVTGTGAFHPAGGTGPAGTTDALAFTAAARSGIGNYTLAAEASDVAGNVGAASVTFKITYDVAFTRIFAPPPCANAGAQPSCTGQFEFTVKRSSVTSDGAPMFDRTVRVDLVQNTTIVSQHYYGVGDVKDVVQIDPLTAVYKTSFRRSLIGANNSRTYVARVYFRDVDGTWMLQATSTPITF